MLDCPSRSACLEAGRRWLLVLIALGLYLSIRGYESLDGDQAYRLPLLLHRQDPSLYAHDPFVRAFDTFNPHTGYLALLDVASRPFGLSPGLFLLFAATFALTFRGIERLARSAWPESSPSAGLLAVLLVLATRAGNIGTNHLFEPMLLDRLIALALGWNALASLIERPSRAVWLAPLWLLMASWVHPSLGLQLAMLLGGSWLALALFRNRSGVSLSTASLGLLLLGFSLIPQLLQIPSQSQALVKGMEPSTFLLWTARVQSPQHMLPHLWRPSQWAAWFGFLALAALSVLQNRPEPRELPNSARQRLLLVLAVNLLALVFAWLGIEVLHLWKLTVFQPFRLSTVARGLSLVLISGQVARLWSQRSWLATLRVALLVAGLSSDLAFVVVVMSELTFSLAEWSFARRPSTFDSITSPMPVPIIGLSVLVFGLIYLHRADTDSGTARLLLGALLGLLTEALRRLPLSWTPGRQFRILTFAWLIPLFAAGAPHFWRDFPHWTRPILHHIRLSEVPSDPSERLALWTRTQIPSTACVVVPPGEKTFRLWSRHSVPFNRSASPYHAAALADWARRYQAHVNFRGSPAEFAASYLQNHLALERRYDAFSASSLADLARRQDASFVVAGSTLDTSDGSLRKLRTEGDLSLYAVNPRSELASRHDSGTRR